MPEIDTYIKLVELSRARGRVNMYKYYNDEIITRLICHQPVSYTHLDVYKRQEQAGIPQKILFRLYSKRRKLHPHG